MFTVLFPILIFHLMMQAELRRATVPIIAYTLAVFILAILVEKGLRVFIGEARSHFAPFLLPTVEGGRGALPLYLSIVGVSSNTVIFDIAGAITVFLIIPVLVSRSAANRPVIKN
ncbi:transporter protein [Streptococcus pseudoporcinus]|uniref:Transporter protein n=1 Tax=Streptococcus pseudoporcinus TaxID=361101 RepID=A0A4U9YGG4_9STRE|nr:hypothetical protein [Streptococcus pseudoporcinus]VTS26440.1 transporter protein [Streptococcus pseudoporcinus]